jgi:hypothetical protein
MVLLNPTAHPHHLQTAEAIRTFALAGNARLTLVSRKTDVRFTYRVRRGDKPGAPLFVSLLSGPDNEHSYQFLGTIFADGSYRHGAKSAVGKNAPSALAFYFFHARVLQGGQVPDQLEVWHEGRCGRCGRPLTVPESIASGIGPVCEGME